jgi:putative SOS response-associated peptidase YedK
MSGWGKRGTSSPIISVCHLNEPLAFAGLWEVWEDKNTVAEPNPYKSCTIITMEASDSVKDTHNRMPLMLQQRFSRRFNRHIDIRF